MASIRTSVLITVGALIGVLAAAIFWFGWLERLEIERYDSLLRSAREDIDHPFTLLPLSDDAAGPEGSLKASEVAVVLDSLQGTDTNSIVINDPVTGSDSELAALSEALTRHGEVVVAYGLTPDDQERALSGQLIEETPNLPEPLQSESVAFNLRIPDHDGILRRFIPTLPQLNGSVDLLAAFAVDNNFLVPPGAPSRGYFSAMGGNTDLPLIRFGDLRSSEVVPADIDAAAVGGANLLIGRTDPEATMWRTPIGDLSDVQVTLMVASQLVGDRTISRSPPVAVVFASILISLVMLLGINQRRGAFDFLYVVGLAGAVWILAGIVFEAGVWVDIAPVGVLLAGHIVAQPAMRRWGRPKASQTSVPSDMPDQESVGSL